MAQKRIIVNTTSLKSDVETAQSELHGLRNDIGRLRECMTAISGMWYGPAATGFTSLLRSDIAMLEELVRVMADFVGTTALAREEYERCENSVSQIVGNIRV